MGRHDSRKARRAASCLYNDHKGYPLNCSLPISYNLILGDFLSGQNGRKSNANLLCLVGILHLESVEEARAPDLEFCHGVPRCGLLDLDRLGIGALAELEELLYVLHFLGLFHGGKGREQELEKNPQNRRKANI